MRLFAMSLIAAMVPALAADEALASPPGPHERAAAAPVRVVATLPVYASIVMAVGGAQVVVTSIADPREDAHFVRPKPSFALEIRRADLFVTTGLDLELWVPALLDRAANTKVIEGGPGYVTAYTGIQLLDVPATADRSAGDIHVYGNPHVFSDPLNAIQIARNMTTGLKKVAPDRAAMWEQGLARFTERIHRELFGERLVQTVGGEALANLARQRKLHSFLQSQAIDGKPLIGQLGGWMAKAQPFRGKQIICYHKDLAYFEARFDVRCAEFVEAKPGIPPTPGHVARLIKLMKDQHINVLVAAEHFGKDKVDAVARRAGARAVVFPMAPGTVANVDDYFDLVDTWVARLASAFGP